MSIKQAFMGAASASQLYVDDVFQTTLYNGNGSTQSITNGIDLSTYGGLVWTKSRSSVTDQMWFDTARGVQKELGSNKTNGEATDTLGVTAFNSNGYTISTDNGLNNSSNIYTSWTFRKAAKFFDVVTYTGNGTAGRTIAHNLGVAPGMIIVKRTDAASSGWPVYHVSTGATKYLYLNSTIASGTFGYWNDTAPTSTQFTVGTDTDVNGNGATYVAYLFAHDTATDGIIQCGSFTGTGTLNLGWEPQFLMFKAATTASDWVMLDALRGWPAGSSATASQLRANLSNAEGTSGWGGPTATGFEYSAGAQTYIYLAIRRSNKPPTSGTQVFMPTVYDGDSTDNKLLNTTVAPDFVMIRKRTGSIAGMTTGSRLTGQNYMFTGGTAAEASATSGFGKQSVSSTLYGTAFSSMNGVYIGAASVVSLNDAGSHIALAFKRAVGVFDHVCYSYSAGGNTQNHALGVTPELVIRFDRTNSSQPREVRTGLLGWGMFMSLASSAAATSQDSLTVTSTTFLFGSHSTNTNYSVLLFATKAGISKVFSVTKSAGSDATVDCGFSSGARFVLLKRTDSTGDWYVWDSARGIVSGNDPYLLLDATSAENTSTDYIDPINAGFTIVNGGIADGSYIGLAFS